MKNIWKQLPKPFFVQAPLEQVSDIVFREILSKIGKPDVLFTEFTNVDGLCSQGAEKVSNRLKFTKNQHPIIAQIWGLKPEHYKQAAEKIRDMGFDGIDLNMGCPDRDVVKKGCCSALIENHALAKEIIQATKEGAKDLPVSVKTRIGMRKIVTEEWVSFLFEQEIANLTIHGRTVAEMSKVPAHWDEIAKAVKIRDQMKVATTIVGNGDVLSYQQGVEFHEQYRVDGIMIGRGMFQNFWIFNPDIDPLSFTISKRLQLLADHIILWDKTWGQTKDFNILKKFYKVYIHGFENASEIRNDLMQFKNSQDTLQYIDTLKSKEV
ncbi:MAG TPA: tRNA-dihydrouridine synthase [Candidatus Levybacteria bacterium]|nr:tRNA-dihydrouridine synthase [Candidatus Levybacteria bacterium]